MFIASWKMSTGSSSSSAMVPAMAAQPPVLQVSDDSDTDLEVITGDELGGDFSI